MPGLVRGVGRGAGHERTLGCGRSRLLLSAEAASSSAEATCQRTGPGARRARRVRNGAAEALTQRSMLGSHEEWWRRRAATFLVTPAMRAPVLVLAAVAALCVLAPVPAIGEDAAAGEGSDEPQVPHFEDGEFADMCAPPPPRRAASRA